MIYGLLGINIILLATGQVLWKLGTMKVSFTASFKGIMELIFNPYILGGGLLYIVATGLWLYILSKAELSKVYPMQSLCYVLGTMAGVFVFNERFTVNKFLGLGLIILGAFFIAKN
ncbi:MAG: EamA family transporter [Clostridium sp.]|uniref:EamA family transporter n=1 Tax=Clostridium sp. TaxID=1506 RepID=UPI002A86015A|nr:EamA family transporter [Clostridium sp.]MDY5096884.1 EamA family transporter [Clostridium sp.]